jgi:SpoVK/Ycf46/Vps4 family AAA+-type ATPase
MKGKTLEQVRVKAFVSQLQSNDMAFGAIITYLASFAMLMAFFFYPIYLIPFIALIPAFLAYRFHPGVGLVGSWFVALPAWAFQSTVFAWVGALFLALVLYTARDHWATISLAMIAIFLPFAPYPFSLLGGLVTLVFLLGGMYLGSKESIPFTIVTILLILLFSSVWGETFNSAFFPLNPDIAFLSDDNLKRGDIQFSFLEFVRSFSKSLSNMVDFRASMGLGDTFGVLWANLITICFGDTGLIQAFLWAIVIWFAVGLTGMPFARLPKLPIHAPFLLVLIVPFLYIPIYALDNVPYRWEMPLYILATILIAQFLMNNKIVAFRESEIKKEEGERKFGTSAVHDLSLSSDVSSFEDFGDYEETRKEIYNSIILPLKHPEVAYAYSIKPPKGFLLFGPPGTGKTFLMKALAKKMDYKILYVQTSELLNSLYGETEKSISKLFKDARKNAPCIILFDEIDSIGKRRSSEDHVTSRVLNTLLQELDGMASKKNVIFVAITNVPHLLDPALIRPGRIDKIIYMPLPDKNGRKEIFKVKLKNLPTSVDDEDLEDLANETERFSGADIALVVNEAKEKVVSKITAKFTEDQAPKGEIEPIVQQDLLDVIRTIRPSTSISDLDGYEKFKYDFERKRKKEEKKEGTITFADVVGMEEIKEDLKQSLELPIKHPELIKEYKIEVPKGILLFGPPGTGKTYLAKAAAGEFKIPILQISGADLMKKGYSAASEEMKIVFNRARENPPSIVFIDEIETIAPVRGSSDMLIGQLLQEMDGVRSNKNIMIIGATNMPQMVDPALLRPGRFDKIIYIEPQDVRARKDLFRMYLSPFDKHIKESEMSAFAKASAGFSAADVKSICSDVKINVAKENIRGKAPVLKAEDVLSKIESRRPSITPNMLKDFEVFMREYGERR